MGVASFGIESLLPPVDWTEDWDVEWNVDWDVEWDVEWTGDCWLSGNVIPNSSVVPEQSLHVHQPSDYMYTSVCMDIQCTCTYIYMYICEPLYMCMDVWVYGSIGMGQS